MTFPYIYLGVSKNEMPLMLNEVFHNVVHTSVRRLRLQTWLRALLILKDIVTVSESHLHWPTHHCVLSSHES